MTKKGSLIHGHSNPVESILKIILSSIVASLVIKLVMNPPATWETWVQSLS